MRISFFNTITHLGQTLRQASKDRGFICCAPAENPDILFVTYDVETHVDTVKVSDHMGIAACFPEKTTVVLVSQVPPGYTRRWLNRRRNIFYQVDTIIMNRALERATNPEQFIIGCEHPDQPLPDAYLQWTEAFNCPVRKMSYESAELTKLAINYYLSEHMAAAADIARIAIDIGADYAEMLPALRGDDRIGKSYIEPPFRINQHLKRDVDTVEELLHGCVDNRRRQSDRSGLGQPFGEGRSGRGDYYPEVAADARSAAVRSKA